MVEEYGNDRGLRRLPRERSVKCGLDYIMVPTITSRARAAFFFAINVVGERIPAFEWISCDMRREKSAVYTTFRSEML